jgi:hypothetical protein
VIIEKIVYLRAYRPSEAPCGLDSQSTKVDLVVAHVAERDEVLFGIVTRVAAKLCVMDLQVRHRATRLTAPAITTQDLLTKGLVRGSI